MNTPTGYRIVSYGDMITDRARMDAYARALRQSVRPGCLVLDIGAGTGIFSLLACQFGAGEVHAVEPNAAIEVARTLAADNGYRDRITFHQALSTAIELPRRADVIVSDLRGVLPLFQRHIPAIADARRRLLAPGGALIPARDTVWAALIEDPKLYRPYAEPWLENPYGLDLRAGYRLVVNTWRKINAKAEHLLVPPQRWAMLDYDRIEQTDLAGELVWTIERPATAHGLLLWFDADLGHGLGFSNAPGEPDLIYGQAFFPLQEPIDLVTGDQVRVAVGADLVGDNYVWRWRTRVNAPGEPPRQKAAFNQSTFHGEVFSPAQLRRREGGHVPVLDAAGQADGYLLSLMDGQRSLSEIARRVAERHPDQFPRLEDALGRAGELAVKYGR
jgi:protein arginine N-methyltransferase 1